MRPGEERGGDPVHRGTCGERRRPALRVAGVLAMVEHLSRERKLFPDVFAPRSPRGSAPCDENRSYAVLPLPPGILTLPKVKMRCVIPKKPHMAAG